MSCTRLVALVLMAAVGGVVSQPAEAQFRKGIGRQTTQVTLNRKRAPKVYLTGTAIRVDATAPSPALAEAARQMAVMLEAELTQHDPRLTPVKDSPETIISVSLVQVDSSRANETREELVSKQTGTKDGKAVYSLVKENRMYVVVSGRVSATFQVREVKGNAVRDSDTLGPAYKRDFLNGVGVPEPAALQLDLLRLVVAQIVPRVVPTIEPVGVLLARPNDEIDELNKLGQKNLWSLMLEKLALVKPLTDKKKDAYRVYNLGVANEALAYAAGDMETSKRLLEEASSYYSKAIESNDDEKYFREPQTRIAEAIDGYTTLQTQIKEYKNSGPRPLPPQTAAATAAAEAASRNGSRTLAGAPRAAEATFTNANVIKLVADGLDEENTIAFVKGAEAVAFNLSPAGLQGLLQGKVSNKVIAAMRVRQTAKPGPARAASRPPAGAPPNPAAADAVQKPAAPKALPLPPRPPASPAKPAAK